MKSRAKPLLTRELRLADNTDMGFRIAQIADLARQMQFTPLDKRGLQIAAAEELLLQIDPAKAYPFNFVLYRITGYHARQAQGSAVTDDGFTGQLLTGLALQHDLGLLIELVSDGMNVGVNDLDEPVFTIDQICHQFNVSDKSIQRWRRRGLAARRFVFPDGKRRVGFLAGSVERFFALHRDGVAPTANFLPVSAEERNQIIGHAARLMDAGFWAEEIIRRIGARLNRSALAISHILCSTLSWATMPPDAEERARIAAEHQRGDSLRELSARYLRPRTAIYRILLEQRLENTARRTVKFIDDPLYHQPDAARAVADIASAQDVARAALPQDSRVPRDLPPYLQSLYSQPLLTPARERALFLKMHFHRFQFIRLQQKLDIQQARWRDLDALESQMNLARQVKNEIVAANLRLVVSVARKHVRSDVSLMDLVSDGNVTLMRAVDSYDIHRGNRFSTYATLALMKEFARALSSRRRAAPLTVDVPDTHGQSDRQPLDQRDEIRQLLSGLAPREQSVLRAQFGLRDEDGGRPETVEEVSREFGLSAQRMRQIERLALAKLKKNLQ
jgi:RNA polymerase primary sigma factor